MDKIFEEISKAYTDYANNGGERRNPYFRSSKDYVSLKNFLERWED